MAFRMFHDLFPKLAEAETRYFITTEESSLPQDEYVLVECFCDEPECDCRKVIFNIFAKKMKKQVAVIDWGWESLEFYKKWFNHDDPETIRGMKGLGLARLAVQSKYANDVLRVVKEEILTDQAYVNRIKRHYKMFKEALKNKREKESIKKKTIKVGRNDPCPCNSGKKYKHCCMK